jgi:hypothetical protein
MAKSAPKIISPIKPLESSSMTHEENEEIHNQLSKWENQINKLNDRSVKNSDLINAKIEIERKMDKRMEELNNSMSIIFLHSLYDRFPKQYVNMQGIHENVEEIHIVPHNHDY